MENPGPMELQEEAMPHLQFIARAHMFALALVLTNFHAVAPAADMPKWSTFEISLEASQQYANPYAAGPTLTAVFAGPGGVTKSVSGFWDGGNSFKIRFTPTAVGPWSYQVSSSDAGMNGKTGSVDCVAPNAGRHGFLRVDVKHPYSFVWDDGTRYFMWGQTYYDFVISALANDHWKTSIKKNADYGMNKIRMHVYAQTFYKPDVEFNGYPDAQPYMGSSTKPDRDRLNLRYWRKLDEMVQHMDSMGMVADLIVTNPYWDNRMFGTAEQNDRFLSYVIARYAAYPNVIWCLCNEWKKATDGGHAQKQEDFDRMGALIRKSDPWSAETALLRPLSIHNESGHFEFSGWPTHAIIQFGGWNPTYNHGDQWGNAGIVDNLGRNIPVVDDEYGYIGQTNPPISVRVNMDRFKLRSAAWGIATAGGYGSIGDIRLHRNGKGNPEITGDWIDAPEYADLKHMIDFFTTKGIEYWKMSSQNKLIKAGTRTYLLAEIGRQYVAYAATGGTFSIDLAPGTYKAFRYDPRTGDETSLAAVTGGGSCSFTLPDTDDWVVRLVATP
jgi:hypothetical protein